MKIAIVSDSHGDLYNLDRAIESLDNIDKIIHLGDHYEDIISLNKKYNRDIIYVAGNNDWDRGDSSLKERLIDIEGLKIFLSHGHRYGIHYGIDKLYYRAKELNADVVLFGHTHRQFYELYDGITFFNPGSIAYPRDIGPGFGLIDINQGEFTIFPMRMQSV
ncbi:metallophosphoesterase [Clostridium cylindrosporum]|uniref:Phosphoesterase n=1 Tax=Clostridium cylindrosporum DSM 605 TaxID=1121307 RepID=A0A0J8G6N6_CLOCY|nr:metallophosphoesterase [Clostridium cylindrosporum]KMT23266.1 phosphoesterase, MJ0936 family [Clostridium cylindrosporum DSM 605]